MLHGEPVLVYACTSEWSTYRESYNVCAWMDLSNRWDLLALHCHHFPQIRYSFEVLSVHVDEL